jgi:site-specific recombinase XerD
MLDNRREKKDGSYPVKLRITYNRMQKYYNIFDERTKKNLSLAPSDFEKVNEDKPRGTYKELKLFLSVTEQKALDVIEDLPIFSFDAFEKKLFGASVDKSNVFSAYTEYINKANAENRIGSAECYNSSMCSLKSFTSKTHLSFYDIPPEFLKDYERWMIEKEKSKTTIGIYLRCLRSIFNIAIQDYGIKQEAYPFGKRKYEIPQGTNIKKALTISDIEKIYNYPVIDGTMEQKARDLWLFSYLCNGMNLKDISLLKYENIQQGILVFVRAKTENSTRRNLKQVLVPITSEIIQIIERLGNKPALADNYVFPILKHGMDERQKKEQVKQMTKNTNKYMRRIAKTLEIEKDVTTYTARHSFATVLKRSGAPIQFISEALGHKDLRTTENYLDSFEDSVRREYAAQLTAFLQK